MGVVDEMNFPLEKILGPFGVTLVVRGELHDALQIDSAHLQAILRNDANIMPSAFADAP